jgi:hypothetical protein
MKATPAWLPEGHIALAGHLAPGGRLARVSHPTLDAVQMVRRNDRRINLSACAAGLPGDATSNADTDRASGSDGERAGWLRSRQGDEACWDTLDRLRTACEQY